jgi:hypothetical protein
MILTLSNQNVEGLTVKDLSNPEHDQDKGQDEKN